MNLQTKEENTFLFLLFLCNLFISSQYTWPFWLPAVQELSESLSTLNPRGWCNIITICLYALPKVYVNSGIGLLLFKPITAKMIRWGRYTYIKMHKSWFITIFIHIYLPLSRNISTNGHMVHILLDIIQVIILTWSHCIKILCITPNVSLQQIKMIKSGPSVMNVINLSWVFVVTRLVFHECLIYITWGTIYVI